MRGILANKMLVKSKVIQALTLSDFGVWSGSSLITVIFPLFVLAQIKDATVIDVGISSLIYTAIGSILNVSLGKFLDKRKGYIDEVLVLALSNFIRGAAIIWLAFAGHLWELYTVQAITGFAKSLNLTSWRILFSKFLDSNHAGVQWGIYDTIMSIGLGIAALLGGVIGQEFGFQYVVLIGGIMSLIATIFPLMAYRNVKKSK